MAKRAVNPERRAEIGRERRARTRAKLIAAAFEIFGEENGLYARIEDVCAKAGVTRTTFYDHISGLGVSHGAANRRCALILRAGLAAEA
jgi:hypothetical protein